jgi:DnaJ-class molecular chaperone
METCNYYKTLDLNHDCTQEEIKSSYRNKAKIYHPDKSPKDKKDKYEEIFKNINNAYSILSDVKKRKIYDNKFESYDFFTNRFMNFNYNTNFIQKLDDTIINLLIDLEEVYFGTEKEVSFNRIINDKIEQFNLKLKINSGCTNNCKIIKKCMGNSKNGYISGDLIIIINYKEHNLFKIINQTDLLYKININLGNALVGTKFTLDHISGKKINFIIDNIFQKNPFVIPHLGLPDINNNFGKLIIDFEIDYNYKLSKSQKILLEDIFPLKNLVYNQELDSVIKID